MLKDDPEHRHLAEARLDGLRGAVSALRVAANQLSASERALRSSGCTSVEELQRKSLEHGGSAGDGIADAARRQINRVIADTAAEIPQKMPVLDQILGSTEDAADRLAELPKLNSEWSLADVRAELRNKERRLSAFEIAVKKRTWAKCLRQYFIERCELTSDRKQNAKQSFKRIEKEQPGFEILVDESLADEVTDSVIETVNDPASVLQALLMDDDVKTRLLEVRDDRPVSSIGGSHGSRLWVKRGLTSEFAKKILEFEDTLSNESKKPRQRAQGERQDPDWYQKCKELENKFIQEKSVRRRRKYLGDVFSVLMDAASAEDPSFDRLKMKSQWSRLLSDVRRLKPVRTIMSSFKDSTIESYLRADDVVKMAQGLFKEEDAQHLSAVLPGYSDVADP